MIEPAVPPISPVSPRPLLNALIAVILGLFVAVAVAFTAEYLDDRVKDSDAVYEIAGLSTLGKIARMSGDRGRSEIYRLTTLLNPRSRSADAYRTLRTNIEFASVDVPIRSLLVTSSVPGEGKTVTAANLAVAFAQAGRKTLLVDADLRKPGVSVVFDLPNSHGLTTLLRGDEMSLDALAKQTEQANLRVLTTGPLPPNPAELLGSQRMRVVLERLGAGGELLILDSPPLLAVTDSAVLSAFLDATLLVIDVGRSHRGAVRESREALAKAGANVLGAVLNRLPVKADADYSNYYGTAGTEKREQDAGTSPEQAAP
jgi:capsular exopolysaccharide synthesis family protein